MTKIKDLVTVSVDSAFSLFPIDSERYELLLEMRLLTTKIFLGLGGEFASNRDSRINAFLEHEGKNLLEALRCYSWWRHNPAFATPLEADRAKRIHQYVWRKFAAKRRYKWSNERFTREACGVLFLEISNALADANALYAVPKGHGGNP